MKNPIHTLKLLVVALLAPLCLSSCHDAAAEIDDVNLDQLLRPSALTAVTVDSESITVSWRATANEFRLEYAKDAAFSDPVTVIEEITANKYTVTELDEFTTYYFRIQCLSKGGPASSEYSATVSARTLLEPRIPNLRATSEMTYTTTPWSITCTVTMNWGEEGTEPEAVSSVRATPTNGSEALIFTVSEAEAAAQQVIFSEGILTDMDYTFELLRGTKVRGTCTHRTAPGPIPALHATSQLDFGTMPVTATAEFTWDLYYIPASDLQKIIITLNGATTPEQEIAVSASDHKVMAKNLTAGVTYTAALVATDARTIASVAFTTPAAPSREVIIARPGDDLAAIISDDARALDSVYLMPGAYTISDVSPLIKRNLVLTSEDVSKTTVTLGSAFRSSGTFDRMVFSNIRFICSTYFLQISGSDYNIDLYRIENCIIDLNSGSTGSSTLFSTAGASPAVSRQQLGRYEVLNSTVYANAGQAQNIVYNAASGSIGGFGKLLLKNSTFANSGRGLIAISSALDYAYDFEITDCTLYNMCSAGSTALIDLRLQGPANASRRLITLRNSILWHGSSKGYKLLQFAGSTEGMYVPKSQITCSNVYYFNVQPPAFGNVAYNITDQMTTYANQPGDLWSTPAADPTAAGASFRIKDQSVIAAQQAAGTTLGDQRWK